MAVVCTGNAFLKLREYILQDTIEQAKRLNYFDADLALIVFHNCFEKNLDFHSNILATEILSSVTELKK